MQFVNTSIIVNSIFKCIDSEIFSFILTVNTQFFEQKVITRNKRGGDLSSFKK